jgi:hypothetical protein
VEDMMYICLFISLSIYLQKLHLTVYTVQRRLVERLMNDRLKSMWKETVVSKFKIVCVCGGGGDILGNTKKKKNKSLSVNPTLRQDL